MKRSQASRSEPDFSESDRPDVIFYNGRIYPDSRPEHAIEALAVWQGLVRSIGRTKDIMGLKSRKTKLFNLKGRAVLPGLTDSHIHLLNYGMLLLNLDLSRAKSINDIQREVAGRSPSRARHAWVLGRGWDDEKLRERRYPVKQDLDKVSTNPVFIKRVCGHVAVANSAALKLSGITANTPDPAGGLILRDPDGSPNGVLKERALGLVERNIPESRRETRRALVLASRKLAKLGLTSLHCIIGDLNEFRTLQELKREERIIQSIYAIIPSELLSELGKFGFATGVGGNGFRTGGVKLFLDGSMGARTAALNEPYDDEPTSSGMVTMSKEELKELAIQSKHARFQMCVHAIGDKAVDLAVGAFKSNFGPKGTRLLRHRIEHSSLVNPEALKEMRRLGVIASVQPRFIFSDNWATARLGRKRLANLYPLSSMIDSGIILAAGSDGPVEDPNPFEGIWSAVTRPGLEDDEGLTVGQSLSAYTTGAAYASFSDRQSGKLSPGMFADLVVLDRDPFEVTPEELRQTQVLKTFVRGEEVS